MRGARAGRSNGLCRKRCGIWNSIHVDRGAGCSPVPWKSGEARHGTAAVAMVEWLNIMCA